MFGGRCRGSGKRRQGKENELLASLEKENDQKKSEREEEEGEGKEGKKTQFLRN